MHWQRGQVKREGVALVGLSGGGGGGLKANFFSAFFMVTFVFGFFLVHFTFYKPSIWAFCGVWVHR